MIPCPYVQCRSKKSRVKFNLKLCNKMWLSSVLFSHRSLISFFYFKVHTFGEPGFIPKSFDKLYHVDSDIKEQFKSLSCFPILKALRLPFPQKLNISLFIRSFTKSTSGVACEQNNITAAGSASDNWYESSSDDDAISPRHDQQNKFNCEC